MGSAASKTIVIVDDDEAVRDSTQMLLTSHGYPTQAFESADSFLEKTQGRLGDCLVVDVQMPGRSGLELLAHLRASANPVPVILMTANLERLGDRGKDAGAITVLRKPFTEDALLAAIALACD